jgi:hypothetical protein
MAKKGLRSHLEYCRRKHLIDMGKASRWVPLRSLEDALKVAGLD